MWNNKGTSGFKWRPKLKIYTDGVNNKFDPETFEARSYNHWVYCRKIKGKVVFNNYNYSVTTSGHQASMKQLLKELKIKVDVFVYTRRSLEYFNGSSALSPMYHEMFEIEVQGTRARKPGVYVEVLSEHFDTRDKAIKALKNHIDSCRKLGAKLSKKDIKAIKDEVIQADKRSLEQKRTKSRELATQKRVLKSQMNSLDAVDMSVYDAVNQLDEIKF